MFPHILLFPGSRTRLRKPPPFLKENKVNELSNILAQIFITVKSYVQRNPQRSFPEKLPQKVLSAIRMIFAKPRILQV